jgi:hypothetical protein
MTTGNFEYALMGLLFNLQQGGKSKEQMLAQWDKERGTDWYTGLYSHKKETE